jgi:tetratricopeptide (TPR) repeat protein
MKHTTGRTPVRHGRSHETGSSAFTFFGIAIIIAVIIGAILLFPWSDLFKAKEDKHFSKGIAAMATKRWNDAISLFEKSLKSNPANSPAYVGRSRAFLHLGDLDRALKEVEQAVMHNPESPLVFGQKGIIEKLQGKSDQALEDFSRATELDPDYCWARAQIADLLMQEGKLDEALESINKAIDLRPKFTEGLRLRGTIRSRMGTCKEALEDFSMAEQLRPDDPMTIQDKAWFLMTCPDEKIRNSNAAFELAKKAFTLTQGKNPFVQETLAEAYFQQGDPLKAAEHEKKAIKLQLANCPDGSCVKEMRERLQKYELSARQQERAHYEILPLDGGYLR